MQLHKSHLCFCCLHYVSRWLHMWVFQHPGHSLVVKDQITRKFVISDTCYFQITPGSRNCSLTGPFEIKNLFITLFGHTRWFGTRMVSTRWVQGACLVKTLQTLEIWKFVKNVYLEAWNFFEIRHNSRWCNDSHWQKKFQSKFGFI